MCLYDFSPKKKYPKVEIRNLPWQVHTETKTKMELLLRIEDIVNTRFDGTIVEHQKLLWSAHREKNDQRRRIRIYRKY